MSVESDQPSFSPTRNGGELGNQRGVEVEQKVANLLKTLPYVSQVVQTEKMSPEDRDMIDLIVYLNQLIGNFTEELVYVQIKASTKGIKHFKEQMRRKSEGTTPKLWLLQHRIIVLNGDLVVSKSGHNSWTRTDEDILKDFELQLATINQYEKESAIVN